MGQPNREREIFERAVEILAPHARAEFVHQACVGDAALEIRVHALLKATAAPDAFLPEVPADARQTNSASDSAELGTVIGRYQLLEQIGEGGFGVVYRAEQLEPVRRRVALKVIKPGMDSKQVISRFEAERQALALMDHPNIAHVFDAGAIPQSRNRPYFVMELVHGLPITRFCDEEQLNPDARLKLFIDVCSAVQHAHQKGIIHRDLKPSNILVTRQGSRPVPKVIDFGIAKAIQQPLTDQTVFTQFQQFLGTPAYMSPEQATLSGLNIDTRSDIYSLGVLLYELLTGSPPFETQELLSAGLDEMRRIIREKEPVRPSTRLAQRRTRASFPLAPRPPPLASDLDWIVLKALAKDPDGRYATVNGLAADLQRHLDHEPVTAVAPTLAYQLSKFYRRRRGIVVAVGAFMALLVLATAFSTWQSVRARRAEARAKVEAQTAQSVAEFFWKGLIKQLSPWGQTNRDVRLREALDVAAGQIDRRLADQPQAEASVRLAVGKAYRTLAELQQAETHLRRALELRRAQLGESDPRTADALFELAAVRHFQGNDVLAAQLYDQAAQIRAQALGTHHEDTLIAAANALFCRYPSLPPTEARTQLEQMLEMLRLHVGPSSDITRPAMNWLGVVCSQLGDHDRALQLFAETDRLASEKDGPDGASALWSRTLAASTMAQQGRFAEAEAAFQEILATHDRVCGAEHILTRDTRLAFLQTVLVPQQRFEQAAQLLLDAEMIDRIHGEHPRPATVKAGQTLEAVWLAHGGGPSLDSWRARRNAAPSRFTPPDASLLPSTVE